MPPRKRILDVEVDGEYAHAEVMFERWIADIEVHRDLARAERDSNRDSRFVVANRDSRFVNSMPTSSRDHRTREDGFEARRDLRGAGDVTAALREGDASIRAHRAQRLSQRRERPARRVVRTRRASRRAGLNGGRRRIGWQDTKKLRACRLTSTGRSW